MSTNVRAGSGDLHQVEDAARQSGATTILPDEQVPETGVLLAGPTRSGRGGGRSRSGGCWGRGSREAIASKVGSDDHDDI